MQQHAHAGRTRWLWMAVLPCVLWGCAKVNDVGMRLVSSKSDAYLIINGQLLLGDVLLVPDRTGRVSFATDKGAIRSCSGGMRYTASNGAEIDLRCSDGTQVAVQTTLLSETRGYGYASTAQGPVSVAFGLSVQDASAFLTAPRGMTLTPNATTGELDLQ